MGVARRNFSKKFPILNLQSAKTELAYNSGISHVGRHLEKQQTDSVISNI